MTGDMKICSKCGIEKPTTEFYKHNRHRDGLASNCKTCTAISQENYRRNHKEQIRKWSSAIMMKRYKCAKAFCNRIEKNSIVALICPVCNTEFGVLKSNFKTKINARGYPPKYCSPRCYHISTSKKWQQTQSPYAKKIKQLQKEYK